MGHGIAMCLRFLAGCSRPRYVPQAQGWWGVGAGVKKLPSKPLVLILFHLRESVVMA